MIEQPGTDGVPLGELLVGRGLLSEEQLAYALAQQQQSARPLGEILVGLGYISSPNMAQALATQRGGVAKTEYGYAVAFQAPSDVPVANLVPPPVTTVAGPVLRLSPGAIPAAPGPVPAPADPPAEIEAAEVAMTALTPPAIEYAEPIAVAPANAEPFVRIVDLTSQPPAPSPIEHGIVDLTSQTPSPLAAAEPVAVTPPAPPPIEYAEPIAAAPATAEPLLEVLDLTPQTQSPIVTEPVDAPLRAELEAAMAARDALAADLAEARAESAAARDELQAVQQEIEDVRAQGASREEETAASVKDEADGLRAQLAELRGMADAVAVAEARAAELERAARDAEARSAQAAGQLQALTAESDKLRESADAMAAAEARAVELEHTAREATEQVQALTVERQELHGRIDALGQELEAMGRRTVELEQTADNLRAALAQRPAEPEPPSHPDNTDLDGRLATLDSRLEHAVDMLSVLRGERESVDALERQLAAVTAEQRVAEETAAALVGQLEERTRQYAVAMAELQRMHAAFLAPKPAPAEQPYLIFATLAGKYELLENVGAVPAVGDELELHGTTHAVVRVGGSPLAGSDAACVYTIPAA